MSDDNLNLTGEFLIAMPGMMDPRFQHALVYMCEHTDKGAMGLIVNKPAADISFLDLLQQLEIKVEVNVEQMAVYLGGPVETGRGFVLHSTDYTSDLRTLTVEGEIALTPTLDVLEDIAQGDGPDRAMMMLGYAGWGPGQLEGEISKNGWLTCSGDAELIFTVPTEQKWARALEGLGIDPALLSAEAGNA